MKTPEGLTELMAGAQGSESMDMADTGAPVTAPMTTPQVNEGAQMQATAQIALAMKMLALAAEPFGPDSDQGKAIMDAYGKLQKKFGIKLDAAEKLIPAELQMLVEAAGQKSPEMLGALAAGPGAAPPMMQAA